MSPKTIDNDLVLTDHSPGYGSAARFVALATMGAGTRHGGDGHRPRQSPSSKSWAGTPAGSPPRPHSPSATSETRPHFIGIPEISLDETRFLDRMEDAYRRYGFALAVIAENVRDSKDAPIGEQGEPYYTDDFGHAYYEGPAKHLAALVSRRLGVRTRHEKPGTIQRSMMACVSHTDAAEAEEVGRAAVRHALAGESDIIVTLQRAPGDEYACTTGTVPLQAVGGKVKRMPPEYIDADNHFVTPAFLEYARPLLGMRCRCMAG